MLNPQYITEGVVGPVRWTSATQGYCRCPGSALHTTSPGAKDCRVKIDGIPTLYCFHTHCASAVDAANKQLRRALLDAGTRQFTRPMTTVSTPDKDHLADAIASEMKRREPDLHQE